ncbi:hypothetical protein LV779_15105 [Streptomyces thinghirensis]|nr:hypothetical protein [Streptomyces thinghirensis]
MPGLRRLGYLELEARGGARRRGDRQGTTADAGGAGTADGRRLPSDGTAPPRWAMSSRVRHGRTSPGTPVCSTAWRREAGPVDAALLPGGRLGSPYLVRSTRTRERGRRGGWPGWRRAPRCRCTTART